MGPHAIPLTVATPRSPRQPFTPPTRALPMARWPKHVWTTLFTYGVIFLGFPLLCFVLWAWVRGRT